LCLQWNTLLLTRRIYNENQAVTRQSPGEARQHRRKDQRGHHYPGNRQGEARGGFAKYSGNEIKIDGEEHLILREDEVLAIIEK